MTTAPQYTTVGTFTIAANPGATQTEAVPANAQAIADQIADHLAHFDIAVSLFDSGGGRWQLSIHFAGTAERQAVQEAVAATAGAEAAAALQFGAIEAADWVRQSLAGLQPVAAGRFVVHGAHDRARVPANRIGIEIEAALAFGTGHHGTTRGCLLALDAICKRTKGRPRARPPTRFAGANRRSLFGARLKAAAATSVLDVGTGSGVLAIAAARTLRAAVLATDIDAFAARSARNNTRHNRAGDLVWVSRANGVGAHAIRARAPYDLIFANILLGPLKRIAAPLRGLAAPGGRVVLSGILPAQANAVLAAYRPLVLQSRLDIDGWTTLVLAPQHTQRPPNSQARRF
jgi:ribosomal protein L11 methyltransferase